MQFYKMTTVIKDEPWIESYDKREVARKINRDISRKTMDFNNKFDENAFFFVSDICDALMSFGAVVKDKDLFEDNFKDYVDCIHLPVGEFDINEITFENLQSDLMRSSSNDFIPDDDDILDMFDLGPLSDRYRRSVDYGENILSGMDRAEMNVLAEKHLLKETFLPELDRIYAAKPRTKAFGNPVHYCIQTDSSDIRREIHKMLLNALYANSRIDNKRYCYVDVGSDSRFSSRTFDAIYKANKGGTMIVRYAPAEDDEGEYASADRENIRKICEITYRYRRDVLTVLCLPRCSDRTKARFYEQLPNMCFVEIYEDLVYNLDAKNYLKMLCKQHHIRANRVLLEKIKEDNSYLSSDLVNIFDSWYDEQLRTTVYSQYKEFAANTVAEKIEKPKGNAYRELMEMPGLDDAKKVINDILNYYKAQKLYEQKGMKTEPVRLSMVFEGSSGTNKTSTARLVAEIFRENGILKKGELIEVSRSQLVGKYVGWSAQMTKDVCRRARDSVLFIDEAYSLSSEHENSFGHEVINELVAEMENNPNMVVIFAGYTDKMQEFMQANEGLRSRVPWTVTFKDYNPDELCSIADYIAKDKGFSLTYDAKLKMKGIFKDAVKDKNFGNGRYVRNLLERSRMVQATRLLAMDFDDVSRDDVMTLTAEDIEAPLDIRDGGQKKTIGFCA